MENKEIEQAKSTAVTTPVAKQRGLEQNVEREDLLFPRTKLLQPTSADDFEANPGLKPGGIINSITKELLPERFIPVFFFKEWLRFNPRRKDDPNFVEGAEPGALLWKTTDPNDPRVEEQTKFGPNGEVPAGQGVLNFFAYFPGHDMPVILSFAKTSYKAGKQLLSLAKFTPGDLFGRAYTLSSKKEQNEQGTYYVLQVFPAGKASDAEYAQAEAMYAAFANQDIKTHDMTPDAEAERPF